MNLSVGNVVVIKSPHSLFAGRMAQVLEVRGTIIKIDFGDGTTGAWNADELELVAERVTVGEDDGELQ